MKVSKESREYVMQSDRNLGVKSRGLEAKAEVFIGEIG